MKVFRDAKGREWLLAINVGQVKLVRALLQVDLLKVITGGLDGLQKLLADPVTFVDILFVLCKDQAAKDQVTDVMFGQAFGGDTLYAAAQAFTEELIDFFPDPKARAGLKQALAKGKEIVDRAMVLELANLEKVDPEQVAKGLIEGLRKTGSDSSGDMPESPVLTLIR